jgi:hypothetical protein
MIRAAVMIHAGAVLSTVIVVLARCKAAQEDHLWVTDDAAGTITKFDASGRRLMMVCSGGVAITDKHKMAARAASCAASISSV